MTVMNIQSEIDGGSAVTPGTWRAPLVSANRRLTAGLDTVLLSECFNATAQNTANWKSAATTFTFGFGSGYVTFNNGSSAAANAAQLYQSYRTFPLMGQSPLAFDLSAQLTAMPTGTGIIETGLYLAPIASTPYASTDGVFYRITAAGLFGVISYNGTETLTALLIPAAAISAALVNLNLNFRIVISQDFCEFWGSDTTGIQSLIARLPSPAANGQPFSSCACPVSIRQINGSGGSSTATQLKVSNVTVTQMDINTTKPWSLQLVGDGQGGFQGQNGGTMGSNALYSNSLAVGAGAAMTNTTAALGVGLGGQFDCQPTLAANTDGIVCSFQNPAGGVNQTPRTLFIKGVRIQGMVTAILVGGPVQWAFSLAVGHTAVSLATAEGVAAKAPRRIPLGWEVYPATAAVDTLGSAGIYVPFDVEIPVNPGEFIAVVAKNVGTVTSSGVITILVSFNSFWE